MSASLVGSEMCIRDRRPPLASMQFMAAHTLLVIWFVARLRSGALVVLVFSVHGCTWERAVLHVAPGCAMLRVVC
eukprot:13105209-Alexandrium_andersonii.AAC.1